MSEHAFSSVICRDDARKCIVLQIGTLTGCPLCRECHPLCRLKNPTVILIWLLEGFHPATLSIQSTPADNTHKRAWQYIEKERYYNIYHFLLLFPTPPLIKSSSGIFKQAIQFVYLSWSCRLYLTDVTHTKSHIFSL